MPECAFGDCTNPTPRANAVYCSRAHRQAAWKARVGYRLVRADKASLRRTSRDGKGMRLYLTHAEVESIARGAPLATASAKAQAKLKPAAPIEGQTGVDDHLPTDGYITPLNGMEQT